MLCSGSTGNRARGRSAPEGGQGLESATREVSGELWRFSRRDFSETLQPYPRSWVYQRLTRRQPVESLVFCETSDPRIDPRVTEKPDLFSYEFLTNQQSGYYTI